MVGPPYETALRLIAIAQDHWATIDGQAAERGVDYFSLSPDQFFNAIWWWAVQRVKDPERFETQLAAPLKVGPEVSERELEADGASFMAFAAAMGVAAPTADAVPSDSTSGG